MTKLYLHSIFPQNQQDKPVYFGPQKNTFIRTARGDQRATQEEIDTFFRTASFEEKDKELTKYSLKDLDQETIKKFGAYFVNADPGHGYNALEDREFLQKLGVLIDNKVTYGGLLVFGTEDILTSAMTH